MIENFSRRRAAFDTAESDSQFGQTIVEFALVSVAFLFIVLATVDFGRSIFLYSELHNAVRDVAREGKVKSANGFGVDTSALASHVRYLWNSETQTTSERPGLSNVTASVSCSGSCTSGNQLIVTAALPFQAVAQGFLGISPLTLKASATVTLE